MSNRAIISAATLFLFAFIAGCGVHTQPQTVQESQQLPHNMTDAELAAYLDAKADAAVATILEAKNIQEMQLAEATLIRLGERCLPKLKYAIHKVFTSEADNKFWWSWWTPGPFLMRVLVAIQEFDVAPLDVRLSYCMHMLEEDDSDIKLYTYFITKEGRKGQLALRDYVTLADIRPGGKLDYTGTFMGVTRAITILAHKYHDIWIQPYAEDIAINSLRYETKHDAIEALRMFSGPEYISVVIKTYLKEPADPSRPRFRSIDAAAPPKDWYLKDFRWFLVQSISTILWDMRNGPDFPDVEGELEWMQKTAKWLASVQPYMYVSHNPDDRDPLRVRVLLEEDEHVNILLIDEVAKEAGIPREVWLRIPQENRMDWDTLKEEEKVRLRKDANLHWQNDQKEGQEAVTAAVPLEIWKNIPRYKREAWSSLSEEEQEALMTSAGQK